jgi:hypothetical protein
MITEDTTGTKGTKAAKITKLNPDQHSEAFCDIVPQHLVALDNCSLDWICISRRNIYGNSHYGEQFRAP